MYNKKGQEYSRLFWGELVKQHHLEKAQLFTVVREKRPIVEFVSNPKISQDGTRVLEISECAVTKSVQKLMVSSKVCVAKLKDFTLHFSAGPL